MRRVPPELVDSVLSCHRDGSPTLRTCSLVCRDWHSLCTHYHMRTTTLCVTSETLAPFLELIGSPHCTLLRWLRGIALRGSADILIENLVDFEVLERIRLVDLAEPYTQICGLPMLLRITSLHIEWARFASFTCFAALLANLPNLNKLTILSVDFASSGTICVPTHSGQAPSLHLDSFELNVRGSSGDAELLEWLSSGADGSASICSQIRVIFLHRNATERLVPYLNLLGNHLKSIHLTSPYSESIPSLDFSRFSQLTTLRVGFLTPSINLWRPVISTGLPNLWMRAVSQSSTLESLVLDVNTYPVTIRRLALHDVEPLASALRVVDPRIKHIQFNVCCEGHGVDMEGNLSPSHFDPNGSMGGECQAENVFRAHVLDRLNHPSPDKCTLRLAEFPMELEL